jgi:hypothetical protein
MRYEGQIELSRRVLSIFRLVLFSVSDWFPGGAASL